MRMRFIICHQELRSQPCHWLIRHCLHLLYFKRAVLCNADENAGPSCSTGDKPVSIKPYGIYLTFRLCSVLRFTLTATHVYDSLDAIVRGKHLGLAVYRFNIMIMNCLRIGSRNRSHHTEFLNLNPYNFNQDVTQPELLVHILHTWIYSVISILKSYITSLLKTPCAWAQYF